MAGRGPQAGQYQSPQQQFSPQHGGYEPQQGGYEAQPGGYESRRPSGPVTGSRPAAPGREYRPSPGGQASQERQDQPFEETAFVDDRAKDEWGGGAETTAIGKLGYMPKEPRRRSDFQKVRSRARKSSPWPKIVAAVVAVALVGGGVWWFMNRDTEESTGDAAGAGLTYEGTDAPCSLVDAGPLESAVNGADPTEAAEAEQKSRGWVQLCTVTYGEPDQAAALLEVDGTVFDSDAKASVNYELGTGELGDLAELWTPVDPAPAVGDQSAAVARIVTDGTSNYQLHLQDDNVYLVLRLSVAKEAGVDEAALTEMTTQLAEAYLENWRDAS
ncbi:hypothetical protein [Glycomyces terrestris]|uniref:Uncharacterized protein n=1 Tax=Glycomyces terrestris TaxID=2493553 RepID=A0A426UX46_9ACTN|nr:hypothetical protein [Glycomyces terrestris]RRR99078.1 hypothetical protein EIW28_09985 [Glycomyces terrestris]